MPSLRFIIKWQIYHVVNRLRDASDAIHERRLQMTSEAYENFSSKYESEKYKCHLQRLPEPKSKNSFRKRVSSMIKTLILLLETCHERVLQITMKIFLNIQVERFAVANPTRLGETQPGGYFDMSSKSYPSYQSLQNVILFAHRSP